MCLFLDFHLLFAIKNFGQETQIGHVRFHYVNCHRLDRQDTHDRSLAFCSLWWWFLFFTILACIQRRVSVKLDFDY